MIALPKLPGSEPRLNQAIEPPPLGRAIDAPWSSSPTDSIGAFTLMTGIVIQIGVRSTSRAVAAGPPLAVPMTARATRIPANRMRMHASLLVAGASPPGWPAARHYSTAYGPVTPLRAQLTDS